MANPPRMHACLAALLLAAWFLSGLPARAADPCPLLRAQTGAVDFATRVAAIACDEHQLWYRPFIDADGRVGGSSVREAEVSQLANGEQAWRRVAGYWRGSGLLAAVAHRSGAAECEYAGMGDAALPACRTFLIDTPWSAAFVSWVMQQAGLPGFGGSSSHLGELGIVSSTSAASPPSCFRRSTRNTISVGPKALVAPACRFTCTSTTATRPWPARSLPGARSSDRQRMLFMESAQEPYATRSGTNG